MRFGVSLPGTQQMPGTPDWECQDTVQAIGLVARRADELGYAWQPCSEHIAVTARAAQVMGTTWFDPAATLAFVAAATNNIQLLTHVTVLPYHNPLAIAKQYATLDALSRGRLILGVGVGHLKPEFDMLGVPFGERGAITDDYIQAIRALWTEERASFEGRHVSFQDVILAHRPVQKPHPPIWVGGNSRRAARRAAELGDGWVPFDVTPEAVQDRLNYVRPLLERKEQRFDVVVPASPVELTAKAIDGDRALFSGSAEQVVEDIEVYAEAGATGITVSFRSASLAEHLETLERFAEQVMPQFND